MPLEDIRADRIKKLNALKKAGQNPYPAKSGRSFRIEDIIRDFELHEKSGKELSIAGRVMARRDQGGLTFLDVSDESGKMQALAKEDLLGGKYALIVGNLDIGDFVEISGKAFTTKRGEKTLEATSISVLAKSIRPLPDKWEGLSDTEERLRRRYLDLVMEPEERELFVKKSKFWQATRDFMLSEGFLEVETPILEHTPGGADAEPFITHLNTLDMDLYLRISPELHLKRLLVAGFEKVFEIGRIFRNEGIDKEHLQDYTQLEFYWAFADYQMAMDLVERMYKHVIQKTLGVLKHMWQGQEINWAGEWEHIDYFEVFRKYTKLNLSKASELELQSYAKDQGIEVVKHPGRGRLIDIIFKKMVRPHLIQPGFLVLPPVDVEPLAKCLPDDPSRVERFQVVACASELGKGYSELNNPIDQQARFEEQENMRKEGDREAQRMDADFVEALEYGMPPTAGWGHSERLFAIIMNRPVRETVFEPLMRPRKDK